MLARLLDALRKNKSENWECNAGSETPESTALEVPMLLNQPDIAGNTVVSMFRQKEVGPMGSRQVRWLLLDTHEIEHRDGKPTHEGQVGK